jgi:hypothetical protein
MPLLIRLDSSAGALFVIPAKAMRMRDLYMLKYSRDTRRNEYVQKNQSVKEGEVEVRDVKRYKTRGSIIRLCGVMKSRKHGRLP